MKRVIILASGMAVAMALSSQAYADQRGQQIFVDVTESKYISKKSAVQEFDEETDETVTKTILTTDTYEVGTRIWQDKAGNCLMEKRTLKDMKEFSGIQFPSIHIRQGTADCETREFHTEKTMLLRR